MKGQETTHAFGLAKTLGCSFTMNAQATYGEISFQITDLQSQPIEGFTFDDCLSMKQEDSLAWPLLWREKKLDELVNQVIRLEVRLRNANVYSFHGDYHFLDAQDQWMIYDGKPIDTSLFDF